MDTEGKQHQARLNEIRLAFCFLWTWPKEAALG